jgi:gluconolactonase
MEVTRMVARLAVMSLLFAGVAAAAEPIPGVGPVGPVEKVRGDFKFVEGPTADAHGNLYFSDIPNERIHRLGTDGKLVVWREHTNKANGLMVNAKGDIVACEMGSGQVAAYSPDGKERRVLAAEYNGKRFNAPNDLVIDRQGGIYFTDPEYSAPKPLPQTIRTFYYLAPDGTVTRLVNKDLPNPNGIILSPDEKTLYLIPTGSADMVAYPVLSPGKIGEARLFCKLKQREGKAGAGGDGLCIDTKGNLYITSQTGIQVFDPTGKHMGTIEFPEQPANCDFGGPDMKTLYVTARTSLYAVKMEATGHRFATGR